jgi:hypothetical protein
MDRNPDQREETSKNGVELRDCVDCSLNGLHLHDVHATEAPLKLERCSWCNITNCHLTDSGDALIDLVKCDNCRVSGCLFRVLKQSITSKHVRVTGGSGNLISDDKR